MLRATLGLCLLTTLCSACGTLALRPPEPPSQVLTPEPPRVIAIPKYIDTGCNWTKPIYLLDGDILTKPTLDAILAHDEAGIDKCGWKAPAPTKK